MQENTFVLYYFTFLNVGLLGLLAKDYYLAPVRLAPENFGGYSLLSRSLWAVGILFGKTRFEKDWFKRPLGSKTWQHPLPD